MNLKLITEKIVEISKSAGDYLLQEISKISAESVETKSLNSLVTYVDKNTEKLLVDQLLNLLPEAGFIAEEGTSDKKGAIYNWIIDPLDGTTNFIHGLPMYSVSVGLSKNNEIIAGVVYIPSLKECFHAYQNGGAFLNNKKIQVSNTEKLSDTLIATGFPYYDFGKMDGYLKVLKHLLQNTRGMRRMGSAAIDLAYVACGRFDSFFEYSLHPWDVAAGSLLVKEAGGFVNDFKSGENYLFGQEIIASNANVHAEIQELIKIHLNA